MHAVDLSVPPVTLGMQAWADDCGRMPTVIFTTPHRIETWQDIGRVWRG
jgi:hypothetical protein